jgi:O-antigen/teichoic acid export membrane protein
MPSIEASVLSPASVSGRGIWALADQGAVSLGNCVTSFLLARNLPMQQFGLFAILLEAMLFLNSLQAALVIYPLSVRGAVIDRFGLRRLAGACVLMTMILALPLGVAVALAARAAGAATAAVGVAAAAALLMWQIQETLRRTMMAEGRFDRALPGDLISYLGQAVVLALLLGAGHLGVTAALAVMGATSLLGAIVQAAQVGIILPSIYRWGGYLLSFCKTGRWVLLGNVTAIVTTLGCSWTLTTLHGVEGVGRFQSLANLLKLGNPLTLCLAALIVPAAARANRHGGFEAARRIAWRYALGAAAILLPYYLLLTVAPRLALRIAYGPNHPVALMSAGLRIFVASYALIFISQVIGSLLNGVEQSRRTLVPQLAQAVATLAVAMPATARFGLEGFLWGWLFSNVILTAGYLLMLSRAGRSQQGVSLQRVLSSGWHAHRESVVLEMQQSALLAA